MTDDEVLAGKDKLIDAQNKKIIDLEFENNNLKSAISNANITMTGWKKAAEERLDRLLNLEEKIKKLFHE